MPHATGAAHVRVREDDVIETRLVTPQCDQASCLTPVDVDDLR